jgi:hypothetical protein
MSIPSSALVPKREFTLAWRKNGRGQGYGVAFSSGGIDAAANNQAALRVLGSHAQRPCCAAPRRFEIQPADIAALLPETFIAERTAGLGLLFRLAGTKICENFGHELRGIDFPTFWEAEDRAALASLLRNVFADAAVGHGTFRAFAQADREASFDPVVAACS